MREVTDEEIRKAVRAKGIDQRIQKVEKKGRVLTLHLLGGSVVKYTLPVVKRKKAVSEA